MTSCFFASGINSFLALSAGMDVLEATLKLTPIIEEILKSLPVFFYLAVLAPGKENIFPAAIAVGLGFATLENILYIMVRGETTVPFALIRGCSTGAMHTVCAVILGYGLMTVYGQEALVYPVSFALLSAASAYHAVYNLFVSASAGWAAAGFVLPTLSMAAIYGVVHKKYRRRPDN
jgi:RsiW-degrading membrane proteinase PrsW (M82 family)